MNLPRTPSHSSMSRIRARIPSSPSSRKSRGQRDLRITTHPRKPSHQRRTPGKRISSTPNGHIRQLQPPSCKNRTMEQRSRRSCSHQSILEGILGRTIRVDSPNTRRKHLPRLLRLLLSRLQHLLSFYSLRSLHKRYNHHHLRAILGPQVLTCPHHRFRLLQHLLSQQRNRQWNSQRHRCRLRRNRPRSSNPLNLPRLQRCSYHHKRHRHVRQRRDTRKLIRSSRMGHRSLRVPNHARLR